MTDTHKSRSMKGTNDISYTPACDVKEADAADIMLTGGSVEKKATEVLTEQEAEVKTLKATEVKTEEATKVKTVV